MKKQYTMKKRLGTLFLLLAFCLAWAGGAWAAEPAGQSGQLDLPQLGKLEIRRLLDNAQTNLGGKAVFASQPVYTAPYVAGDLSPALKQAALARFNALRRIAGLPSVSLDEELCRKAQHAAVLMTATNYASGSGKAHEPEKPADMSADFYALGSEGAAKSNLYRATDLLVAIDFWLDDPGNKNLADLGHRRWQLNPAMGKVGFGYSAGTDSYNPCSVEWVLDKSGGAVDYDFVAWPASGNFPAEVFAKNAPWSVTVNPDKYQQPEAAAVRVKLTRAADGRSWSFGGKTYQLSDSGTYFNVSTHSYGLNNCIVFRPEGIGLYDGAYQVEISGLRNQSGQAASLSYTVDFFGAPRNFYDVRGNDYFAGAVRWVVSAGIASGVSDRSFAPNATCTRGEILTMLWRANGSPLVDAVESFVDLDGKFYQTAALWAGAEGLVAGPYFEGDKPCSRGEVVYYLWVLAGRPQAGQDCAFADVSQALAPAVAWAVEKKITTGATAAAFEPQAICTRGQIATFIYRAYRW